MNNVSIPEEGHVNKNVNPEREAMGNAMADVLEVGYTLTTGDMKELTTQYGYSPNTPVNFITGLPGFKEIMGARDVCVSILKYRGRSVYYNGNLPLDETDIEQTKSKIDSIKNKSTT